MQHRVLNLDNVKLIKHRLRDGFCPVSKVGGSESMSLSCK